MRVTFGEFVFDSQLHSLTQRGRAVELSPKAFILLQALIEASPAPLSKDALYDLLWPDTFVEPGNLHNLVADIREALSDQEHATIRTIHRVGYAFAAPLRTGDSSTRFLAIVGEREFPLGAGEHLIGRDPACAVVINSPDVSRHHARLLISSAGVFIEDLGSKNGTFVETKRAEGLTAVTPDAGIVVGRTAMLLREAQELSPTV